MRIALACIAATVAIVVGLLYAAARPPPVGIVVVAIVSVVFFAGLPVVIARRTARSRSNEDRVVVRKEWRRSPGGTPTGAADKPPSREP